jgi:hypothetical protein
MKAGIAGVYDVDSFVTNKECNAIATKAHRLNHFIRNG